jgi:hypothetical protein
MLQFERVSLHLGTLCGAIPLDNFLANDYDDTGELDYYREFEKQDIRCQEQVQDDNTILDSDSEESERSDVEDDDVMQMLLSVGDPTEEDGGEENGSANRALSLHGNAERDSRASNDGSHPMPKVIVESEADGSRHGDPLQSNAAMRREAALEKLHMACKRLSGTVEALRFEFIEEGLSGEPVCFLTFPCVQLLFDRYQVHSDCYHPGAHWCLDALLLHAFAIRDAFRCERGGCENCY